MPNSKILSPLYEHEVYHIYNRGNNGENLFYTHENYLHFLRQYGQYLSDYIDTFAYCLLPNHFHLLVRIKSYKEFPKAAARDAIAPRDGISTKPIDPEETVSEQFRRLFIGYSMAINKQQERTGSLFQKPFKRKQVKHDSYFNRLVYYIHANPQLHGITDDFRDYPYSSYTSLPSDRESKLLKREVMDWFGSKKSYYEFHSQQQDLREVKGLTIED